MKVFDKEELLEPVVRYFRFREGAKYIEKNRPVNLVDLGCGPKIRFFNFARTNKVILKNYLGIDPLLDSSTIRKFNRNKIIKIVRDPLKSKIPLKTDSVDYVVGFAFLEHIDNPGMIINESIRLLRPGGKAIFTTPSTTAKPILEILSYRLGLISRREIAEHKTYFNRKKLLELIDKKFRKTTGIIHKYFFLLRTNNLLVIEKLKTG